jgi:hypothetical protein
MHWSQKICPLAVVVLENAQKLSVHGSVFVSANDSSGGREVDVGVGV